MVVLLAILLTGCDTVMPKRSEGEKLFRKHCAKCHGVDGAGETVQSMGDPDANLLDESWRNIMSSSEIPNALSHDLVFKHPTFSQRLTPAEIKQVARYVLVLRGERRPEP